MYPFLTLPPGASASLHEATTPSPLFTWYPTAATAAATAAATSHDVTLAELDTCIKFHQPPPPGPPAAAPPVPPPGGGAPVEFMGSATFTSGRHRWTVQLDNFSTSATHIMVGRGR